MNTLLSRIQALLSDSNLALTPMSAVLFASVCADTTPDFTSASVANNNNFYMGYSICPVSAILATSYNKTPAEAPDTTFEHNLSYFGGLSPISALYSATLEPNVKAVEFAAVNEEHAQDINYMAGMGPISALYSATLEPSVKTVEVESLNEEHAQNINYMAGMSPISALYSATLEPSVQVQEPSASIFDNALNYLAGMNPISALYSATLEPSVKTVEFKAVNEEFAQDINYMAGMSPISAVCASVVAEQDRVLNGERELKSFAVENDGFAMSPAMSLVSGVFCAVLNEMQSKHETVAHNAAEFYSMATTPISAIYMAMNQELATPAHMAPVAREIAVNEDIFFAANIYGAASAEYLKAKHALTHASVSQRELIKSYQISYAKRGYDPVQSLIMASVSAARDCKDNAENPLFDAATEERVAKRWDSIWNQMSIDNQTAANEITYKAPFERYYNSNGQLINNKLHQAA